MSNTKNRSSWDAIREAPMAWDNGDVRAVAPANRDPKRPPPIPIKIKDAQGRPVGRLPGVNEADWDNVKWDVTARKSGKVYPGISGKTPLDASNSLIRNEPQLSGVRPWDLVASPVNPLRDPAPRGPAIMPQRPRRQDRYERNTDWDGNVPRKFNAPSPASSNAMGSPMPSDPFFPRDDDTQRDDSTKTIETMPPQHMRRGRQYEASPAPAPSFEPQATVPGRRPRSDLTQQIPTMVAPTHQKSGTWDVVVPGEGTFRVQAATAEEAKQGIVTWFAEDQEDPSKTKHLDARFLKVTPTANEGTTAGALGGQSQTSYESVLHSAITRMIRETVRKKAGGGGYALYGPNKGKKKKPKQVGEFPTRLAARRAELARFPPKDPEQLKRARERLDKIAKDPEKRAKAEHDDLTGRKKNKKSGRPARSQKKTTAEGLLLTNALAKDLQERLFHEDEIPGSPWDERISSLHPDAISSDRKLHAFHKGIETASMGSLGDAHKALAKVMRGMAKVHPGDIAQDPERRKTFMPITLDCDGIEIGPVHLYIDGGHVKVEISQDARQQISDLEPDYARDLRGGLMSFQEDHLPNIAGARNAWNERDSYLDKLHGKLEKHAAGLSGVEHHLMRQLLAKSSGRRK